MLISSSQWVARNDTAVGRTTNHDKRISDNQAGRVHRMKMVMIMMRIRGDSELPLKVNSKVQG